MVNGPQFVSKFFEPLCTFLVVNHLRTTAHCPQTDGQAEHYNKTIVVHLCHYVLENKSDWDQLVQPLTYAHNTQVHRATGTITVSLFLSRQSPGPTTFPTPTAMPTHANSSHQQNQSANTFYSIYPKCATRPRRERNLLTSASSIAKTPKSGNKSLSTMVNSFTLTALCFQHRPKIKWKWKHTPIYFHVPIATVAPSGQNLID